jgi:hypothetical protein
VNDTFRQAGVALGVAALGALVPTSDAFGGSPQGYVDGLHHALLAAAALAAVAALAAALLIKGDARTEAIEAQLVPEAA